MCSTDFTYRPYRQVLLTVSVIRPACTVGDRAGLSLAAAPRWPPHELPQRGDGGAAARGMLSPFEACALSGTG